MTRIGVFGASFNPPTRGHEDVVNQALAHFDEVLLVPSLAHPFGKTAIPLHHRLEMLRLFVEPWQQKNPPDIVKIFNIEALIQAMDPQKQKIYTYDVLSELDVIYRAIQRQYSLHFILGPDNAAPDVWKKFYRYNDIETQWGIFIATENVAVHSTLVRKLIANSTEDKQTLQTELIQMVSEPIANYILQNSLYCDKEDVYG